MHTLRAIRWRTVVWLLLFPMTFLGWLPWWLHHRLEGPCVWAGTAQQWIGLWLMVNGLGLAGWCVQVFNVQGQGTPFPLDPPRRFVAMGPYQFVRNPMAIGMFLLLGGQAALDRSLGVLGYLLLVMGLMHVVVRFVEEPQLARRFGAAYTAYKQHVPRWIPRSLPCQGGSRPSAGSAPSAPR